MLSYFKNSPEYEARLKKPFSPPTATLKEIHDAVPSSLLERNGWKALAYIARDVTFTIILLVFASRISPWSEGNFGGFIQPGWAHRLVAASLWLAYWFFQGFVWAGIFCLGHDAGHGTLFNHKFLNNTFGFLLHSWLLIPYFSWRASHHAHHKATSSIERDENYVPYTRSEFNLPLAGEATQRDYAEIFEETPIYTLGRMLVMQTFGWWIYLMKNTMGNKKYPPGTNHFSPFSPLFKPSQRYVIVLSNIGLVTQTCLLAYLGRTFFLWSYLVPYLLTNHWIVMFTFLHHSDPTLPHYRKNSWTFLRGAAATVDRPLLGWVGRFFMHNISHDHIAHHFFIQAPFYNAPEITKAIKSVLKDDYNYDSTPSFYALYRSFTECQFIEEGDDIVFYKNGKGEAARWLALPVVERQKED